MLYAPILLALFAAVVARGWRKWPDLLIDFGRELYVPWRISAGDVLYADVEHLFGPLSAYANGTLFRWFGASYTTLIGADIVVAGALLLLVYLLVRDLSSDDVAFACCAVVTVLFVGSQYIRFGNYNFLSPYSHEATHGMVLSLLMMRGLHAALARPSPFVLAASGAVFGLIGMTKLDILLAAALVAGVFFAIDAMWFAGRSRFVRSLLLFLGGASVPTLLACGLFSRRLPVADALAAVCGAWVRGLDASGISANKFYLKGMGFDDPAGNLLRMLRHTVTAVLAAGAAAALCHLMTKHARRPLFAAACGLGVLLLLALTFLVPLDQIGRSLPLLLLGSIVALAVGIAGWAPTDPAGARPLARLALVAVFALGMVSKMLLFCRLHHYGFYLALPAVVVLVVMLLHHLPRALRSRMMGVSVFRAVAAAFLALVAVRFFLLSDARLAGKTFPVGRGADRIMAYPAGADARSGPTAEAIEWIERHLSPSDTFVVVPEGVILNYLTRRRNPTRYTNFMVPELRVFGEAAMLDAFRRTPPEYFVVVDKNTAEYGVGPFGADPAFGKMIMDWIRTNYAPVFLAGADPLQGKGFGVQIVKRR